MSGKCLVQSSNSKNIYEIVKLIWSNSGKLCVSHKYQNKLAIDFSSPNIAKLFHAGHLRSTLIGNLLSNLYKALNCPVIKINYLGDCGRQLTTLIAGIIKTSTNIESISIKDLTELYIDLHETIIDETFYRDIDEKIKNRDPKIMYIKQKLENLSLLEYDNIYKRLGVYFDFVDYESNYSNDKNHEYIFQTLRKSTNSLNYNDDGTVSYIAKDNQKYILQKSNQTSLYLTRDIAAALYRLNNYNPEELIYVVESGQHLHFKILFEILNYFPEAKQCKLTHLKFGRLTGMQTRKGTSVYVKDLIENGTNIMIEKMKIVPTTKVEGDLKDVAEELAISGIIVNVLKEKRCTNYKFCWDRALDFKNDSGIYLQYTHARLSTMLKDTGDPEVMALEVFSDANTFEKDYLELPKAFDRMSTDIFGFEKAYIETLTRGEPYIFLEHLFKYCRTVNYLYKLLSIKSAQNKERALSRTFLFICLRLVLQQNLKLLGIHPLNQI